MSNVRNDVYDSNYISNSFNRDSRLGSISMNAVREAVKAFGRSAQPFTDNDYAIMANILALLQGVGEEGYLVRENEHQHLSVAGSSPAAPQSKIANILGLFDDEESAEDAVPVKAKVSAVKAAS